MLLSVFVYVFVYIYAQVLAAVKVGCMCRHVYVSSCIYVYTLESILLYVCL